MLFEIGATILGLIQGILVMFNKRSNWLFYIWQMLFLVIFSYQNHLYGDMINNGIYIIMGICGFILWNKSKKSNKITKASKKEKIIYITIMMIATLIVGYLLNKTQDPLPYLDAFTTVSSLIATYYMVRKKIDTWIIWFINDIFYVIEYFTLPDQAIYLGILNIIWTLMAIASYINWIKIMKKEEQK